MITLRSVVDIATPVIAFTLLLAVGLNLTPSDFARVRRAPSVIAVGLLAPLAVLPAIALMLTWWFEPDPFVEAGLLLVAACPIGGISNTYSYLARASTALSVTLTGLSSAMAIGTIPLMTRVFEHVAREPLGASAPVSVLVMQMVLILALPVGLGMAIRHRLPAWAAASSTTVQRLAFVLLAVLLLLIIAVERHRIAAELTDVVMIAAVFVTASFAVGWLAGAAVRASGADRFTLGAEFATRNVAIATAIAVTLLGRTEFAAFASVYFLTELPIMLAAVVVRRRWRPSPPERA
ncbi:MAG: bile acid:sodium symporter family protein [Rhodospirillaceae bacterium]